MVLNGRQTKVSNVSYEKFLQIHKSQLSAIPKIYWPSLYEKIVHNIFDGNKYFELQTKYITYSDHIKKDVRAKVSIKNGINFSHSNNIFLIQYLMSYHASESREMMKLFIIKKNPVIDYLRKLINIQEDNICIFLEKVLLEIWRYLIPYTVKINEYSSTLPFWGITDELGMTIKHSFEPNCMMLNFQYLITNRIYLVLFPIKNIKYGEEITRDFTQNEYINEFYLKLNAKMQEDYFQKSINYELKMKNKKNLIQNGFHKRDRSLQNNKIDSIQNVKHENSKWSIEDEINLLKKTLLLPWEPENAKIYFDLNINFQQHEPTILEFFHRRLFKESYHLIRFGSNDLKEELSKKSLIKVYIEDKVVTSYLTDNLFQIVDNKDEADIWWISKYFLDFSKLYQNHPNILINQFPLGHFLTEKDILHVICRRKNDYFDGNIDPKTLESHPIWLPPTFNLNTELVKFVSYFYKREQFNLDNHWIIKSNNLRNAYDIFITKDLNAIIRLRSSGNKVACKYIENPVLFYRNDFNEMVKFELRYFVLLTSVLPLKLFVYKAFQIDLANKTYDLDKIYNQEIHLTDMRVFEQKFSILNLDHLEFIKKFNYQYRNELSFDEINLVTMKVIRNLFELATEKFPFAAINHNHSSSSLYQIDVLLKWSDNKSKPLEVQPVIIECNLNPNCQLICDRYPDFYNDVFKVMFLKDEQNCNFMQF